MSYVSGTVTVTVDYGYDIHSIKISGRTYRRIQGGKALTIKGQGFHWDATPDQDFWQFNTAKADDPDAGAIYVYTLGGGEIFIGNFQDGRVWVKAENT